MTISIYDHTTAETIIRELDETEQAQRDSDEANYQNQLQLESSRESARASAIKKLVTLGLTADEIAAL